MSDIELIDDKKKLIFSEIGLKISQARKLSRKKIDTVSKILKIKTSYLLAIENGKHDSFSDEVYLKGFIKCYAGYLGVDISSELNILYTYERKKDQETQKANLVNEYSDSLPNHFIFLIVLFTFIMIIFAWKEYQKIINKKYDYTYSNADQLSLKNEDYLKDSDLLNNKISDNVSTSKKKEDNFFISDDKVFYETEIDSKEIKKIHLQEKPYQNKDYSIDTEIKLHFFEETWIQVRDVNEVITESGIYKNGEVIFLMIDNINTNYFIDTGNSGGFKIIMNNKEYPILGDKGEVKKNVSLLDFFEKFNSIQ